jgi:mRNA-degrading endonuclease RelE of RelBE toxin-antitoxin system
MVLMPNSFPSTQVVYTAEFKRNVRQLAKKYRYIKCDVQPIIDDLTQGRSPGDQIPGVPYEVFKVRTKNSDATKGKRGGYRIIYYRPSEGPTVLITIYSKTEQSDITPAEIRRIILDREIQGSIAGDGETESDDC